MNQWAPFLNRFMRTLYTFFFVTLMFVFFFQSAPEQSLKDYTKSSIGVPQAAGTSKGLHSDKQQHGSSVKHTGKGAATKNLTNGYHSYGNADGPEVKSHQHQERGRTREKRDDLKDNSEFLNQIAMTVQNLQRDLDRITGRVRGLEGQALQALAPKPVNYIYNDLKFSSKKKTNL